MKFFSHSTCEFSSAFLHYVRMPVRIHFPRQTHTKRFRALLVFPLVLGLISIEHKRKSEPMLAVCIYEIFILNLFNRTLPLPACEWMKTSKAYDYTGKGKKRRKWTQKVKWVFHLFLLKGTCAIIFSCVDNKSEQIYWFGRNGRYRESGPSGSEITGRL